MTVNTQTAKPAAPSLIDRMAKQFNVDSAKLWATLKNSCFKPDKNGREFTSEEVMAVLLVAEQLGLNPLRREIWAFLGKNGVVQPIVSIDGWKCIMVRQPNFDGYQIKYSDTKTKIDGYELPEWCECTIYCKNLSHPVCERVFMQEVYVPSSPVWKKSPRLMLHHRALIQAIRFAFPVSGISDVAVSEDGTLIQGEDIVNGNIALPGSAPAARAPKQVAFAPAQLENLTLQAIAMAKQRNDFAPAYAFANSIKGEEQRNYVLSRLDAASGKTQPPSQPSAVEVVDPPAAPVHGLTESEIPF